MSAAWLCFHSFRNQLAVHTGLKSPQILMSALSMGFKMDVLEPGTLQGALQLFTVVKMLMTPPPKSDVDHFGSRLNEGKLRPFHPVHAAPVILVAVHQVVEVRHGDPQNAWGAQHAIGFFKKKNAGIIGDMLQNMLRVNKIQVVFIKRQSLLEKDDQVRVERDIRVDPVFEAIPAASDMKPPVVSFRRNPKSKNKKIIQGAAKEDFDTGIRKLRAEFGFP